MPRYVMHAEVERSVIDEADVLLHKIIEVSITQNDNIFSQVYLFICYSFNILRMTNVKSEIEQVCKKSVKLFAHLCKLNSNFNI